MRRRCFLIIIGVALVIMLQAGAPAPAAADVCDKLDLGGLPSVRKLGCKAVKKVGETGQRVVEDGPGAVAQGVARDAVGAVTEPVFEEMSKWVGAGALWLVVRIGKGIQESTTPRLNADWFREQYALMVGLAGLLALPMFFLGLAQAVMRRDWSVLARVVRAVPWAFFLMAAAIAMTSLLLQATDSMSLYVAQTAGSDSRQFFGGVEKALNTLFTASAGAPGVPLFVGFVVAVFTALAAFAVWIELLLRSAAIYVCVLFMPIVLAARIWPPLEKWAKRLAEGLTAIILSKFVLVAVLTLAGAGLATSGVDEGFNGALAGAALLLLAAFAPLVLFRLVSFADTDFHQRGGSGGSGTRGASQGLSAAHSMRALMARNNPGGGLPVAGSAGGGRGSAGGGRLGGAAGGGGGGGATAAGGGGTAAGAGGGGAAAAGASAAVAPAAAGLGAGMAGKKAGQALGQRAASSPGAAGGAEHGSGGQESGAQSAGEKAAGNGAGAAKRAGGGGTAARRPHDRGPGKPGAGGGGLGGSK